MICDQLFSTAFILVAVSFVSLYFYVKHLYSYWKRRGVPQLRPTFPYGNFGESMKQELNAVDQLAKLYHSTTEPFIGVYSFFNPMLLARDPEFIRNILIKDFANFTDRGVYVDEKNDPISGHLFSLEGDKWKNLRMKLTPTFTSGKMKAIFTTLLSSNRPLLKHIEKQANKSIEVYELTAAYTTNIIASVAFGIECDCFAEPDHPFRKCGRLIFEQTLANKFRFICFHFCPKLLKWSRIGVLDRKVKEFFTDMVKQSLEMRENKKIVRKDFFQLLVQLRNTGSVQLDDEWQTVITNENSKTLSIDEITAQSFLFYAAGFETSAQTLSFCLYEIAKNPDIQRKVHEEVDNVLAVLPDNQFTYDSLGELKYLECCIDETLRLFSVVPSLSRQCTKDYRIPGTNVTLEKGTIVNIPIFAIQRDEKYYPRPDEFIPERFAAENRSGKSLVDMPYLPFGDGPRNCIGIRMGKLSTKFGIASILHKFDIELDARHIGKELRMGVTNVIPNDGIHLKFKPRQSYAN